MALRYRKSIKLGKGVKLNIGKKSAGISLGGKYGGGRIMRIRDKFFQKKYCIITFK